jgi:NAD dependent epimerase/dehydratase family enzyme
MNTKRIVLSGGSGFLGRILAPHLHRGGYEVVILSRAPGALDFCRAIDWIMAKEEMAGPVNVAAPNPLPNRQMMRILRETMGVPFGLPATAWMLEIGAFLLQTETELIVKSRRVVPARLLATGFEFRFPGFRDAVADLVAHGSEMRLARDAVN